MLYDADAIMHVGEAGLEYLDEYDGVCFINFEVCGRNAVAQRQNPAAPVCVAHRIVTIDPAGRIEHVVEFFTHPPTRFAVASDAHFQRLRFQIEQMGWRVS